MYRKLKLLLIPFLVISFLFSSLLLADTLTLRPNGDSSNSGWNPYTYTGVDEVTLNEADYISALITGSGTYNLFVGYAWPDHTTESGVISDVIFYAQANYVISNNGGQETYIKFLVPDSTTWSTDAVVNITTSSTLYHSHYTTNPRTGVAWTWAEIDGLIAGVHGHTVSTEVNKMTHSDTIFVFQTYIEVNYTPSSAFTPQVIIIQ